MPQPTPAYYQFSLYRGDTRVWQHFFNEDPADWAASAAYVAGVVGSGVYLANSTVTYNKETYTCTTAHTSGSTFDVSKWQKDSSAVGPEQDITDWVFLSEYRQPVDGTDPLASDTCTILDGPGGVLQRTLSHTDSQTLPIGTITWDLQATVDGTVQTYLTNPQVKVTGDTSR